MDPTIFSSTMSQLRKQISSPPGGGGASPPHATSINEVPILIPDSPVKKPKWKPRVKPTTYASSLLPDFQGLLPLPANLLPQDSKVPGLSQLPPPGMLPSNAGKAPRANRSLRNVPKNSNGPDLFGTFDLPDGWKKTVVQRKNGQSAGGYDIYLHPPKGKKLRSNNDLLRYVRDNPSITLDTNYVNMERPIDPEGRTNMTNKVSLLEEGVRAIKETGIMPEGLFANASNQTKSYARVHQPVTAPPPPKMSNFSQSQVIQLEARFYQSTFPPTEDEITLWSAELDLQKKDVAAWFNRKWSAKRQYEKNGDSKITIGNGVEVTFEGNGSSITSSPSPPSGKSKPGPKSRRRPIKPDIVSSTFDQPEMEVMGDDQNYVIEYDSFGPETDEHYGDNGEGHYNNDDDDDDFDDAYVVGGDVECVVEVNDDDDEIIIDDNPVATTETEDC